MYDRDHQAGKTADAIAVADRASLLIEERIDRTLGASVILENDIEEELGITDSGKKNKPYKALSHAKSPEFVLPRQLQEKIMKVYS